IVAETCVELLAVLDEAFRKPRLSQARLTHTCAFGEKLFPVITTGWSTVVPPVPRGSKPTWLASIDVMTGEALDVGKAETEADTEGTANVAGAESPPPGCGFSI